MHNSYRPFVSYSLLSATIPQSGKAKLHCHLKRGFNRARKKDLEVEPLLSVDNSHQRIGKLSQRIVYEFFHHPELLNDPQGIVIMASYFNLAWEFPDSHRRLIKIIENYYHYPFLKDKEVITLLKGDEDLPKGIPLEFGNYQFQLVAQFDCVCLEQDQTIHIVDFKTGKGDFDRRQGYIYLLAASYLYPDRPAICSFYNLETRVQSPPLTATPEILNSYLEELAKVSQRNEQELAEFRRDSTLFLSLYPPNPGVACKNCNFASICDFSNTTEDNLSYVNFPP